MKGPLRDEEFEAAAKALHEGVAWTQVTKGWQRSQVSAFVRYLQDRGIPIPPQKSLAGAIVIWCVLWLALAVMMFVYASWLRAASVALGATHRETAETLEFFSMPLGWVNPGFVIHPDTGSLRAMGIILANTWFWTFLIMVPTRVVQGVRRRSRTQTLDLSGAAARIKDDDDSLMP